MPQRVRLGQGEVKALTPALRTNGLKAGNFSAIPETAMKPSGR